MKPVLIPWPIANERGGIIDLINTMLAGKVLGNIKPYALTVIVKAWHRKGCLVASIAKDAGKTMHHGKDLNT